ncbi:MAG: CHASE2 domain-containing protein [Acidobacteria bacterium]|nr:CHASE2 domain-containing protein [Acidobacteriota bacterium]
MERHTVLRILYRAVTVPVLAVVCLLISLTSLFDYLNLKSYDILLQLSPRLPPLQHVVVVGIDDASIAVLGRLPWDREVIARLIDRINAARPAAIGVDLFLDLPSTQTSDTALSESLQRASRVVLPAALIPVQVQGGQQPRWLQSLPEFHSTAVGHVNASPDSDGICRRIQLSRSLRGQRFWAFALELARQAGFLNSASMLEGENSLELGPVTVPARRSEGYEVLIHYGDPSGAIPVLSAVDLLSDRWDRSFLNGKIVLLGVVSPLEADQLFTPVSTAGQPMPGILIHANVVNMLVGGSFLTQASPSVVLATLLLLTGVVLLLMQWYRSPWHWVGILAVVTVTTLGCAFLFWYGRFVLPFPTLLFASLTAIAVFHVQRLATVRRMLRGEVHRLATQLPSDATSIDPASLIGRSLDLLRQQTHWDWVHLKFSSGGKELIHFCSGSALPHAGVNGTPHSGSACTRRFANGEYLLWLTHPVAASDAFRELVERVGGAVAHQLGSYYRSLQVRGRLPGWREVLKRGYDEWQLHVLRQIGAQWHADRSAARAILECVPGGILVLDFTGLVRYVNQTAARLLPFFNANVLGQDFFAALHAHGFIQWKETKEYPTQLSNPGSTAEISVHCKEWLRSDLHLKCSAIHSEDGTHLGSVVAVIDVTDQRRLDAAKEEMIALVSHELRTPLTSVHGFAQQLLRYSLDPERVRQVAEIILRETSRLDQMTRSYLDLSRLEQQLTKQTMEPANLVAIAQAAIHGMKATAENCGVVLRLSVDQDIIRVRGHAELLERAVNNLLDNAIKYSKSGSEVRIRVSTNGAKACVEVRDHGIGIPAEALPYVFEKFYRVKSAAKSGVPGSGLGLAFVREVATRHGGTVSAKSVLHEGSVFDLHVPLWRME